MLVLTNDRVLAVFQDYIREDSSYEVVQTSRGYTLLEWNEKMRGMTHNSARRRNYCGMPCSMPILDIWNILL